MTDFTKTKDAFTLPEGMIYLDGNSLGPLPKAAPGRIAQTMTAEWGEMLITGWNKAGWMDQPSRVGDRIGRLIGAEPGSVVMGDTLSIKVFQALSAALNLTDKKVILSDTGNFPSDLYMADGIASHLDGVSAKTVAPEDVADALHTDPAIGVLMLTEVDYRTGRRHDMAALSALAQAQGVRTVWDLAHSAGATDVDLSAVGADFAVGCSYKFLNSGPGGPAFIYVAPALQNEVKPILSGWLGHRQPFAFDLDYAPGSGIERMRVGTPPVLQLASLEAALDVWDNVDMAQLRQASMVLGDHFIGEVLSRCPELTLASPSDPHQRGSQVSFHHPEGFAIMQALIARGVVGDFRAPDIIRFGITPLYIGADDLTNAAKILADILDNRIWDAPEYKVKGRVT